MSIVTARGVIEVGRLSGFVPALKSEAHMYGIECKLDVDAGWLTHTVRFTLKGDQGAVVKLLDRMRQFIDQADAADKAADRKARK